MYTIRVSNSLDPDQALLSGLVKTVCKGYQQTTKVGTSGERVKGLDTLDSANKIFMALARMCARAYVHVCMCEQLHAFAFVCKRECVRAQYER